MYASMLIDKQWRFASVIESNESNCAKCLSTTYLCRYCSMYRRVCYYCSDSFLMHPSSKDTLSLMSLGFT
jgi:hypothetical protein